MANIQLENLFKQKQREFRSLGARTDRLREDFVSAVNEVIEQINLYADLETAMDQVASAEGTVGLDELYLYPFSNLLSLRLIEMGQRPAKGHEQYLARLYAERDDHVDMCRQGIINAATSSDTDDDTTDIAGLGALG